MIWEQTQVQEYRQLRHSILLEELKKFEIAFILFQNEYVYDRAEKNPSDTTQTANQDKLLKIKAFLDQTKNLLFQDEQLNFSTIVSIQQQLEYMITRLASLKKLYQVKNQINNGNADERKGKRFSKKANLILIQWLCEHFEYPYPTLEEQMSLSQKCQLTFKQVQSWFINSRGKIVQKTYNEKKFKNLVKEKYLSQFQN